MAARPLLGALSSTEGASSEADARVKLAMDAGIASLSSNGVHVVVDGATHTGLALNPEHARLTAEHVLRVVRLVHHGQSLTP